MKISKYNHFPRNEQTRNFYLRIFVLRFIFLIESLQRSSNTLFQNTMYQKFLSLLYLKYFFVDIFPFDELWKRMCFFHSYRKSFIKFISHLVFHHGLGPPVLQFRFSIRNLLFRTYTYMGLNDTTVQKDCIYEFFPRFVCV